MGSCGLTCEAAAELARLRAMEARAHGLLEHLSDDGPYATGGRTAARVILGTDA